MADDELFHRIAVAIVLIIMPVAIYHRIRSTRSSEKLDRKQEGWFILISLRLIGFAALLSIWVWLIDGDAFEWARFDAPVWSRWAGVVLAAACGCWLGWMFRTLGKNLTDTVVTRKEATLVTGGPYRYVRHPMYVGVVPYFLAFTLMSARWLFAALALPWFVLVAIRSRKEEENLAKAFGAPYLAYRERTGRFFPRL